MDTRQIKWNGFEAFYENFSVNKVNEINDSVIPQAKRG